MAYGMTIRYAILLLILSGHAWYGTLMAGPRFKWRLLAMIMGFGLGPLGLFLFAVLTLKAGLFSPPRLASGWSMHIGERTAVRMPRHCVYWGCRGYDSDA